MIISFAETEVEQGEESQNITPVAVENEDLTDLWKLVTARPYAVKLLRDRLVEMLVESYPATIKVSDTVFKRNYRKNTSERSRQRCFGSLFYFQMRKFEVSDISELYTRKYPTAAVLTKTGKISWENLIKHIFCIKLKLTLSNVSDQSL